MREDITLNWPESRQGERDRMRPIEKQEEEDHHQCDRYFNRRKPFLFNLTEVARKRRFAM